MLQLFWQLPELQESKRSRSGSPPPPPCGFKHSSTRPEEHGYVCCQCLPDSLTQVWRSHRSSPDQKTLTNLNQAEARLWAMSFRLHMTRSSSEEHQSGRKGKQLSQKYTDRDCKCMARHLLLSSLHLSAAHSEVIVDWFQHGRFFQLRSTQTRKRFPLMIEYQGSN